jgi:hypothetical protein
MADPCLNCPLPDCDDFDARGVQDGFGHVWPLLGRLGPRWCER